MVHTVVDDDEALRFGHLLSERRLTLRNEQGSVLAETRVETGRSDVEWVVPRIDGR